jgi:hypothetical protein
MTIPRLPRLKWTGTAGFVARWWTMHRISREVSCTMYTHPEGWEVRLEGKHAYPPRHVCGTDEAVHACVERWRGVLELDGWEPSD